jgi:hypothetical protein
MHWLEYSGRTAAHTKVLRLEAVLGVILAEHLPAN